MLVITLLLVEIADTVAFPALATYTVSFCVVCTNTGTAEAGKLTVVIAVTSVGKYDDTVFSRLLAT